jgi:hypothetical protein
MRFVTKTLHARLDYPVALALITLPFILKLGASHPLALTVAPIVGVAALLLTVFTDHHLGLYRVLPYRVHLAVDLAVGLLFLALPFLFGFTGLDRAFYLLNGTAVVLVVGLAAPDTALVSI